ncbi:uncharacterized protein LOC106659697 [Trichogramma pretiosum]|uniref:uncharacterized protein LOC106659697 n=1 Tax=Trichogramma pretiosum TaxID=7493 RepID=UPI0006C9C4B9|nr:uncharacterized protein LOC106659697 [Trichogramma pretiosum]
MSFYPECPMFNQKKYQNDEAFKQMEVALAVDDQDRKETTDLLKEVIEKKLISLMKRDQLFQLIFDRIDIGGSDYKGTNYGKPNEVELHLVHKLGEINSTIDSSHYKNGYVKIKLNYSKARDPNYLKYRDILPIITDHDNYLDQTKFQHWLDGVFSMAIETFFTSKPGLSNHEFEYNGITFQMNHKKPGPRFTMSFTSSGPTSRTLDVKLVSAFEFNGVQLSSSYERYNDDRLPFRVTLKPFDGCGSNSDLHWRLSFLENEKDMLRDELKPVIKLIKKLRDVHDLKRFTGYQIETIFYHEMFKYRSYLPQFLGASKTFLFIHGLKELLAALEKGYLASFWNSNYRLIDSFDMVYYDQGRRLRKILYELDSNIEGDPVYSLLCSVEYYSWTSNSHWWNR